MEEATRFNTLHNFKEEKSKKGKVFYFLTEVSPLSVDRLDHWRNTCSGTVLLWPGQWTDSHGGKPHHSKVKDHRDDGDCDAGNVQFALEAQTCVAFVYVLCTLLTV